MQMKVKIGSIEVEINGPQDYVESQLRPFVKRALALLESEETIPKDKAVPSPQSDMEKKHHGLGMNTIAQRLDVNTGTDLVFAAVVGLHLEQEADVFSRAAILRNMRKATHYYKETHRKHLSEYLGTLLRSGKLIERSAGNYALHATAIDEVRGQLAS